MDAAEFHAEVYRIIRLIPHGRVTSYGHIAKLMGMPRHARHVGNALKFLGDGTDVPWQRVIGSSGQIMIPSPGSQRQQAALEEEGVEVTEGRGGESRRVNLVTFGWFPESLDEVEAEVAEVGVDA